MIFQNIFKLEIPILLCDRGKFKKIICFDTLQTLLFATEVMPMAQEEKNLSDESVVFFWLRSN